MEVAVVARLSTCVLRGENDRYELKQPAFAPAALPI